MDIKCLLNIESNHLSGANSMDIVVGTNIGGRSAFRVKKLASGFIPIINTGYLPNKLPLY